MAARALHYVFKVANRAKTIDFYTNVLNMKVLRHEEFDKGCEASCNGPYDERWSKTMIGYGSEDEHFVIELTYNYPIHKYELGNDYRAIVIDSDELFEQIAKIEHRKSGCGRLAVKDPDGHEFKIGKAEQTPRILRVQLNVGDLEKSKRYWNGVLGMEIVEEKASRIRLSFGKEQCELEIVQSKEKIERKTAFGRIAFSYPGDKLQALQDKVKAANGKIINELLTLKTPGKADVQVVILADPDEHEICFVGDEGFRALSKIDEGAEKELREQIAKDDSEKWDRFPLEKCPFLIKLGVFKHLNPLELLYSAISHPENRAVIFRMSPNLSMSIKSTKESVDIMMTIDESKHSKIRIQSSKSQQIRDIPEEEGIILTADVATVLREISQTFQHVELKNLELEVTEEHNHDELLDGLIELKEEPKMESLKLEGAPDGFLPLGRIQQFLEEIIVTGKVVIAVSLLSIPDVSFPKEFYQMAPSFEPVNLRELAAEVIVTVGCYNEQIREFVKSWMAMEVNTTYLEVGGDFQQSEILRDIEASPKWMIVKDDEILGYEVKRADGSTGILLFYQGFKLIGNSYC